MPAWSGGVVSPTWFPDIVTCGAWCGCQFPKSPARMTEVACTGARNWLRTREGLQWLHASGRAQEGPVPPESVCGGVRRDRGVPVGDDGFSGLVHCTAGLGRGCRLGPVGGPAEKAEDALAGPVTADQNRGDQDRRDSQRD